MVDFGGVFFYDGTRVLFYFLDTQALNAADITVLYKLYSSNDPPPVWLIRNYLFLELLIKALFSSSGARITDEHKIKYIFLLAYAVSVIEVGIEIDVYLFISISKC